MLLLRLEKCMNQDFNLTELMNLIFKKQHQVNQANRIKSWFRQLLQSELNVQVSDTTEAS